MEEQLGLVAPTAGSRVKRAPPVRAAQIDGDGIRQIRD